MLGVNQEPFVLKVGEIHSYRQGPMKWPIGYEACFRAPDGTIYLPGKNKSIDGGKSAVPHNNGALDEISILRRPEGAVLSRPGLFLALDEYAYYDSPGVYQVKTWRSTEDDLRSVTVEQATLHVPDGPKRSRRAGEWWGLYFFRAILEMPDGSLLASMEGHFDSDRVRPTGRRSAAETGKQIPGGNPKQRTFVVTSEDKGRSWRYLSTVAYPQADDDAVGEGFGEPSIVSLDNGQLLCVMRSGNYTPLYSARSSDEGRTWTGPVYTGLERGVDPCLIKLADGRLLLAFGQRFPAGSAGGPGEPGIGASLIQLAMSPDGTGRTWQGPVTIGAGIFGTYPTIIEVEPNLIFCHAGGEFWRLMLMPRVPETL